MVVKSGVLVAHMTGNVDMPKKKLIWVTLISASLLIPLQASACGESLFRVGKGVAYREYTAPLPGKILIVAKTDGELALAQRLTAAGHDVLVVSEPELLRDELAKQHFDIVMTLFKERQIVEQARMVAASTVYLPVAAENSPEEKLAKAINRHAPSTDDSVKAFLKAIHRTLKEAQA